MIKINTIDDIKKATDSELYEYFTINFIKDIPIPQATKEAFNYYIEQSEKYWTNKNF